MHRNILTDAAVIGVLTIAAKLVGALKMVVTARYFGAGDQLDAYLIAFLVPSFVSDVLAGAIAPALLPVFIEVRQKQGVKEAESLYLSILASALGLLTALALVLGLTSGVVLPLVASSFTPGKLALTRELLFLMLPIVPLSSLGVTWRTLLNAQGRFAAAAFSTTLTPLMAIVAVVLFGRTWGIHALAAGTTAGAVMELVVLAAAVRGAGAVLFSRWRSAHARTRDVFSQYVPVACSNLIMGGSSIVDQSMAAMLGSGSVSELNYGTRLVAVLLAIGPAALGTAIMPRLSQLAATENWREFRRLVRTYGLLSVAVTLPATMCLMAGSTALVRLFFERGAFTAADTSIVAGVQTMSLVQIPFSVLLSLLVRVVSSLQANRLLLRLAVLSLAANVVFNLLLMRWYGVAGIALSTALVHSIGLGYLTLLMFRRMHTASLS